MGKDVAEVLGYSNPRKALSDHVDSEDKGVTKRDTLGGTQEMTIINESGLYSLVLCQTLIFSLTELLQRGQRRFIFPLCAPIKASPK